MKSGTIELIHVGGTRKTVDIISASATRLAFRWEMAGVYELILLKNYVMRAPMWSADDIQKCIALWMEMTGKTQKELLEARYLRHVKGMPT